MDRTAKFIDTFCEEYDKLDEDLEEEQKLPSKEVLNEVCSVLLDAGCMPDEGRFSSFRVCFLDPGSEFLDAYIFSHSLLFDNPIPFNVKSIHKLAPAINPTMSYLVLDTSVHPFLIRGIIVAYTTWEKTIAGEQQSGGIRMPRIPNIAVYGPGIIAGCFGETPVVTYKFGNCVFPRTDVFTTSLVADKLRAMSSVPEREWFSFLSRVIWRAEKYAHGGALLIVPDYESCAEYIDVKYKLPSDFVFDSESMVRSKELMTYADFVAKLTAVDGAVLMTKDFELIGFGAEILTDRMTQKQPSICFLRSDNTEDKNAKFTDNGTRHRSGYRFADSVEGAIVIVISQDGVVKVCTKHQGRVHVFNEVVLSLG